MKVMGNDNFENDDLKRDSFGSDDFDARDSYEDDRRAANLKKVIWPLAILAVVLAGILAYVWVERNGLVKDLRIEKEQLTAEMFQLQEDYANLTSDYDTLNVQLDAEREKVEQLIERIQQTDATNRAKIRQYEKELGTLRSIMKHYIYQIDSLNTLNTELRADAAKAREEAAESQRKYEEAVKVTEDLSSKVEQGQVVKGRGITLEALNRSGNVTNRHSRVEKLRTSLSLVENEIAEKGWRRVYVRVKDPSGILLVEKPDQQFEFEGASLYYSSSREVDYNGNELDIVIYFSGETEYVKGVYTVEVYTDEALLGTADMLLK